MSAPDIASRASLATPLARFEAMCRIRAAESRMIAVQQAGGPGTCTSVGQEACAVGVVAALGSQDRLLTNHRSLGHLLARGAEPGRLFAEVMGRVDGYCMGRSGSLHISAKALGVVLTSTIVGAELSMAPGVAWAQTMGHGAPDALTAVFFGDGAACEGIFHESLNLAVQWRLPVLYVCEDNQWQAFVHRRETMPENAIPAWAASHGLMVESVDGNDVEAVYAAALRAIASIRENRVPAFLYLSTWRQRGHYEPDDRAYVDPEEAALWQARDPIAQAETRLAEAGQLDAAAVAAIDARIAAELDAATAFAEASPWPDPSTLVENVYA